MENILKKDPVVLEQANIDSLFKNFTVEMELKDNRLNVIHSEPDIFSFCGYSENERAGLSFSDLIPQEEAQKILDAAGNTMSTATASQLNCRLVQKYGVSADFFLSVNKKNETTLFFYFLDLSPFLAQLHSVEGAEIQRNFMAEILQTALFEYDFETKEVSVSYPQFYTKKNEFNFGQSKHFIFNVHANIHPDDKSISDALFEKLKETRHICSADLRIFSQENFFRWIRITAKTLFANEKPQKIFGSIAEIDEQKAKEMQEESAKRLDPLTQLLNFDAIQKEVISELNTRMEIRRDALALLNFNNLAEINERLGRVFADEIVIFAVEKITELCKDKDCILGRISGDEILIFFKDIKNDSDLQEVFLQILDQVQKIYVGEIGIPQFDIFIGAVISSGETELKTLLEKAQKTIYLQKIGNTKSFLFYSPEIEKKFIGISDETVFDRELLNTENASENRISDLLLDILSGTKNLDSAVNLSLMKIGKMYNLASIRIKEITQNSGSMEMQETYDWASKPEYKNKGEPIRLSHQEILQLQKLDERYIKPGAKNTDKGIPPVLQKIYPWHDTFAFAQNKIYNEGKFFGFAVFLHNKPDHVWSSGELSTLRTLSKILSGYMLQIRAFNRAEVLAKKLSQSDPLTGFYHYDDFRQNVVEIIANDGGKNCFIISALDVRGFKYLNEFYGFKSGNLFLKSLAEFVSESPYFEMGCRMFSDIFFILSKIPKSTTEKTINATILKNIDYFLAKQSRHYPRCNMRIVCGTCKINLPEVDVQKAMDNANSLRKEMKTLFKNCSKIYSKNVAQKLEFRQYLTNSLPNAFAHHEFLFYLQPKIDLKTGAIVGAEALARWKKDGKILQPGDFIPSLEENGLITMIDFYIYESVCKYISKRLKEKKQVVPISVNVSGRHLLSSEFIKNLLPLINSYKIPPELMEFELTETTFLDNLKNASEAFSALQREGFKISIDDFGSGYSSTTLLKELPFDIVKLDKNFLAQDEMKSKDKIVLTSIIDMAKKLDIKVLCEGAEFKEQVDFLKNAGCDMIQGFYFSKPLPVEEFDTMLDEEHNFTYSM